MSKAKVEGVVQASIELYAGRELQLKIAASWTHTPTYCTPKTPAFTTEVHTVPLCRQICSQPALVVVQYCSLCLSLWCSTPAVSGLILRFGLPSLAQFSDRIHKLQQESVQVYPQAIEWFWLLIKSPDLVWKLSKQSKKTKKKWKFRQAFITREMMLLCTLARGTLALVQQKQVDEMRRLSCEGSKGRREPNLKYRSHYSSVNSQISLGEIMFLGFIWLFFRW